MRGTISEAITGALGVQIESATVISGGDVADAYRLDLSDRRTVFAKTHADPPPGFFKTEAAGLGWMRDAGTVAVPEVLAVEDDPPYMVLEWIEEGSPTANTEEEFGRDLAQMHASGAPVFGRQDCRPTGSLQLPNDPADSWVEFYGERRLLPLASVAEKRESLDPDTIRDMRSLAGRLDELLGPAEAPARLHGDLWAGNRLVDTSAKSWLIDPACIGGHREFDLAMMRLFGGFGPGVEQEYFDAFPPAHGWEERIGLHQVAPLVVHAIKFGGSYVRVSASAIKSYL